MVVTFAYKNRGEAERLQAQGYHVIDCRCLANPWSNASLRNLPGTDERVIEYIRKHSREGLIEALLEEAAKHTRVAFGCYGGHHRSVAMAQLLK